jgi:hypothetical protein
MVVLPSPVCSADGAECCTAVEGGAELVELVLLGWLLTTTTLLVLGWRVQGLGPMIWVIAVASDPHFLDTGRREGLQGNCEKSPGRLGSAPGDPP